MNVTHLYCSNCAEKYEPNKIYNLCEKCGKPLLCEYDLEKAAETLTKESLQNRVPNLWSYAEVLYIKDESTNPTQSFKARGMAVAVSMAKELGVQKVAAPSAGNAAGALSAYAALARMECHIFMPKDTPRACIIECKALGACFNLIECLIID